jgi:hypothetical protein
VLAHIAFALVRPPHLTEHRGQDFVDLPLRRYERPTREPALGVNQQIREEADDVVYPRLAPM